MVMLTARAGMLCAIDCYDERFKLKRIGMAWIKETRMWVMPLTTENLNSVLGVLKDPIIEASLDEELEKQKEKEAKLRKLAQMSKKDTPVKLRVRGIKLALFNYQKLGVMFFMANMEGVLFADEMGLGKTLESIATCCYLRYEHGIRHALLVVPAAVKWNWPIEIEKFTNEPYVVIDGSPDDRVKQWSGNWVCSRKPDGNYEYKRGTPFFYVTNYELITEDLAGGRDVKVKNTDSPETATRKVRQINRKKKRQAQLAPIKGRTWGCVSLDEAHYIKTHKSKRSRNVKALKTDYRIALTGTPLDGKLEELHSIMEFVKPGLFASKTRFLQRHADFDYWGRIVKYKHIDEVRARIAPFYIRRLKKDVKKDLPDKTYLNRYVELSPVERKIYEEIADREHPCSEDTEAMTKVLRCKQFCDHPALVLEDCKSSKMEAFLEVVEELVVYNGEKVIVFTQYKEMLDLIDEEFGANKLKFLRIDGDTPPKERAAMQEKFNEDSTIDAIIGTEAMSTGLNLVGATYVINYDDNWAPAIMRQREDRAHREGQKNAVTVINFIVRNTIEERIRSVLYDKEVVSSEVLGDETDEMVLKRLGPQDIAKLI